MPRLASVLQYSLIAVAALGSAAAQQPAPGGTISGSVIDAMTGAPLARAIVTLTTPNATALLVDPRATSPSLSAARTVTTLANGVYRFGDLPVGTYRLRIQRVGYEPATIDVQLGDAGTPSVSVGLVVLPVRLRAVEVHARDAAFPGNSPPSAGADDRRISAARLRQTEFVSTDAREITDADVTEAATLGGRDVLRSLERLPGVALLDDWSAELWVRGNRWDHTRVYYDGLPLFDPLGVLGRTSGVSADAIGGAFLQPGVRSVAFGGDGATRIDFRSRPVVAGGWRGSAELAQFGASGAVERGRADSSAGFLVTAQHSLGRWLPTNAFAEALSGRLFNDGQATARGDIDLGDGKRLETSGLFTHDARTFAGDANQEWQNGAGRVSFLTRFGSFTATQSVGASHYGSRSNRFVASAGASGSPIARPVTSSIDYLNWSGRIDAPGASNTVTSAGYDLVAERASMLGTHAPAVWSDTAQMNVTRRGSLSYVSAWLDNRASLGERVMLENGVRVDVGGGHGLDAVRPAASAQAAFAFSANARASLGASRTYQYLQAIQLPVVGQGQTLPTSWVMSGDGVPLMSVDNATAGIEAWMSSGVLATANVYVRHTTGSVAADPTPGSLIGRPLFVDASESASGIELGMRRLAGRVTGSIAYSYGTATTTARGLSFPSPSNRTHSFSAVLASHVGSLNFGGAYALASGAPYTRIVLGQTGAPNGSAPVAGPPNGVRLPAYASLDLSVDYTRVIRNVSVVGFAGAQNVLGRTNATWYEITGVCDGMTAPTPECRDHDVFDTPVKLAPTIGIRLVVR